MTNVVDEKILASGIIDILKANGDKYANSEESKSLLAVYEEKLFVWHSACSCVLTVDLAYGDASHQSTYKTLLPTDPPVFEVDCLLFNSTGALLALYGSKGLMVMQIPRLSTSSGRQNRIFCKSWHVAERFFVCSGEVSLLQVLWHPGSSTSAHLVTLSTDNYLRIYDATDPQTPLQALCVTLERGFISSAFRVSFPECYGETAVSFDFGPAEYAKAATVKGAAERSDMEMIYPIYILNANGDVYVAKTGLKKKSNMANIEGPLPMYPAAEDNYGTDACSVLCLHSTPPILVVAMASGVVYHCLVLDSSEDAVENPWLPSELSNTECEVSLYIHGSIELPISPVNGGMNDSFSHLIRLYRDVAYHNKYHCSLACGIYTVVLPFALKLEEYIGRGNTENLSSLALCNDSIVEHLLCTKPLSSVEAVPVIGLASYVVNGGLNLLCLLASWEMKHLLLLSSYGVKAAPLLSTDTTAVSSKDSEQNKNENFYDHIQKLLQRSVCTPLLRTPQITDGNDYASAEHWLELVSCTISRLQKEYVERLCTVHSAIQSRIKILAERKVQQTYELDMCLEEKEQLRNNAEALAEKYDDVNVNQQKLVGRIERVMKLIQKQYPVLSCAEVNMKHSLVATENKIKVFQTSLEQIKKKLKYHEEKHKGKENSNAIEDIGNRLQNVNLGETQMKHVMEILYQEGKYISDLVRNVSLLKKEVGL